ncbi:MAG: diguanylate cyclase [Sterolibacterium sp.]
MTTDVASSCEVCAAELGSILHGHKLQARFQPVADFSRSEILGYLTRVRLVSASFRCAINLTGNVCIQLGILRQMTRESLKTAVDSFVAHKTPGLMFYPLPQGAIREVGLSLAGIFGEVLETGKLPPTAVVVAFPSTANFEAGEFKTALRVCEQFHDLGLRVASSDFGCFRAESFLWNNIQPNFLILDDHLFESVDRHVANQIELTDQLSRQQILGRQAIATGIKTLGDFNALKKLNIGFAAGDFFGRFNSTPTHTLSAAAHKAMLVRCDAPPSTGSKSGGVLEKLLTKPPFVTPHTKAEEVFLLFEEHPDLRAIAVVEKGIPRGLIARYEMVDNMSRPFRHELYGRKTCTRFMDPQPLIVDIKLPLAEISETVVNADPRHLISGFIITDHDEYVGMGSVQDLVREITMMQMDAAKYSNPLTQLPGNVPINQHIDNLLANHESCCICYCDLDHFKPFNDVYGYAKGDEVIQLTGRILSEICDAERDFIGHIGGDDFVLVLRSADCEERCRHALARFGQEILGFFSTDDIERGGYVTENRKGQMEFQEIISLSIGAFSASPEVFKNHLQVSVIAAEVKKKAKAIKGNSFFINQREYLPAAP